MVLNDLTHIILYKNLSLKMKVLKLVKKKCSNYELDFDILYVHFFFKEIFWLSMMEDERLVSVI